MVYDKIEPLEKYFQRLPKFAREHSERVGYYSKVFADEIYKLQNTFPDIEKCFLNNIKIIGRYHDIGKIGISVDIWESDNILGSEQWEMIRLHPAIGKNIICNNMDILKNNFEDSDIWNIMSLCCFCHHERWDGKGYPSKLKGEEIPLAARIIEIADAYDAMISDRPYHKGISKEKAKQEIYSCKGTQFDPNLAEIFCSVI